MGNKITYTPPDITHDLHPCRVWDINKQLPIGDYISINACAKDIGLKPSQVHEIIKYKRRNKTSNLGIIITIRTLSPL